MDRVDATVFVVDGDRGLQDSLHRLMQSAGLQVAAFASAEEFLDSYTGEEPGCVLLELRLPGMGGVELMEAMRSRHYGVSVIIVTGWANVSAAVRSMKLGAIDFMEKPIDDGALVANVKAAIAADAAWRRSVEAAKEAQSRLAALTTREHEILMGLAAGKSSKQIAAEIGVSPRTVENHRAHVLAKTGASNVAHVVRIGMLASMACEGPTCSRTSRYNARPHLLMACDPTRS